MKKCLPNLVKFSIVLVSQLLAHALLIYVESVESMRKLITSGEKQNVIMLIKRLIWRFHLAYNSVLENIDGIQLI